MWPVSSRFLDSLNSPVHQIRSELLVLDDDFKPVAQFRDVSGTNDATDILVDGTVDIDISRGSRRTFTSTLLNDKGQWSPNSNWSGLFYVNRLIQLYRGIEYGSGGLSSAKELVPIGTFMIDHADVIVERNMSVVVLAGSDLWKKISKSLFPYPQSWASGSNVFDVIKQIANGAGISKVVLNPDDTRPNNSLLLNVAFNVEQGDNRGDAILKLATDYGIEAYFDPVGRFVVDDFRDPEDTRVVWTLDTAKNTHLMTVRATFNDDNLYNHILVIGTGNKDAVVTAEYKDINPLSPTSIARIGDRVFKYETDTISSQSAATSAAKKLFYQNVLTTEDIELESICNPALEGADVITVNETEFSKLTKNFLIRQLSIPLAGSRQNIKLQRTISLVQ